MSKKFDRLLESATDTQYLEPNWDGIIACFDSIRSNEVPAKAAIQAIRRRVNHENPHVAAYTLLVLDACVKNCGHRVHQEVATREFMEEFKNLAVESRHDEVRNKVLEMLQCWAMAFANKPEYKIIVDTHNLMKLAGFEFPSIKEADAMFMAQVAPDWQDGDVCFRCRTDFGILTRKHHCRACGQIFCDRCSSKGMPLPQFGIERDVRVCDSCFDKGAAQRNAKQPAATETTTLKPSPEGTGTGAEVSTEEKAKLLKEKEEEDLALALAMSQSEHEAKERERQKYASYNNFNVINDCESVSSVTPSDVPSGAGYKGVAESEISTTPVADDPLARYLNRDYWANRRADAWAASAPPPTEPTSSGAQTVVDEQINTLPNISSLALVQGADDGSEDSEAVKTQTISTLKWCDDLKEQVGAFESRVRSNVARGRPVVNDSAVQGLFARLTELHSQVLERMAKLDGDRGYYESLQDHIAHITDARSAVDALRADNERQRQERLAEEQRMRQTQMKQTLDMMRLKKHAMLMEQRETALQRFQAQDAARRQPPQQMYYGGYGIPQQQQPQHAVAPPLQQNPQYYQNQQPAQAPGYGGAGSYAASTIPGYGAASSQPPQYSVHDNVANVAGSLSYGSQPMTTQATHSMPQQQQASYAQHTSQPQMQQKQSQEQSYTSHQQQYYDPHQQQTYQQQQQQPQVPDSTNLSYGNVVGHPSAVGPAPSVPPNQYQQGSVAMGSSTSTPIHATGAEAILTEVRSTPVVVYSKDACPYCVKAKKLLEEDGIPFAEKLCCAAAKREDACKCIHRRIKGDHRGPCEPKMCSTESLNNKGRVDPEGVEGYVNGLMKVSHMRTVPQIFVCGKLLGGYDSLVANRRKLKTIISTCSEDGGHTCTVRPKL